MIRFHNLCCDNTDHSEVPGWVAEHDGLRRTTIVLLGNTLMHSRFHDLLQGAPLLVHRIEELGETLCLMGIIGR